METWKLEPITNYGDLMESEPIFLNQFSSDERVYIQEQEQEPMELDLEEVKRIIGEIQPWDTETFKNKGPARELVPQIYDIPETVSGGGSRFSSSGEVAPIVKMEGMEAPFPGPYFPNFELAQYPFSKEELTRLIALGREYPLPYDCTINSLEIMGFIDREGAGALRRKFVAEGGQFVSKVNHCLEINFMKEHTIDSIDFTMLYYSGYDSDILFNLGLKEGHAIICNGSGHIMTGSGHSFVCYKHDGNLYVYEPHRPDKIIFNVSENPKDGAEYFKSYTTIGYMFSYNTVSSLTNIKFPGNIIPKPMSPLFCGAVQKVLKYYPVLNDIEFIILDYQVGGEKYREDILNGGNSSSSTVAKLSMDVLNSIHSCFPEISNSNDLQTKQSDILNYMNRMAGRFLILIDNTNNVISCCFLEPKMVEGGIFYFIHTVCTNPDMRGKGGCSKLIKFITEWYDGLYMLALDVRCNPINESAIKCYEKNGFSFANGIQKKGGQVIVNLCKDHCRDALHFTDSIGVVNCQMFRSIGRKDRYWHQHLLDNKKFVIRSDGESYKVSI